MLEARLRKNLDTTLLFCALATAVFGLVALYSVTRDSPTRGYAKQAIVCLLGLAAMVGAAWVDPARFTRWARGIYLATLGMLALVLLFGAGAKGATRWIPILGFQFQPSEFAKLGIVICLAVFLTRRIESIREPGTVLASLAYIAVPLLLIFLQPDLGTSLVLMAVWLGMLWVAGARWQHLGLTVMAGLLLFIGAWQMGVIKEYQRNRLVAFINPDADAKQTGYHVIQARIAIGSGQVFGKGLGQGTQSQGRFVPENHTDFIFSVIGEEGGFAASVLLVALYAGILMRGLAAVAQAEEVQSRLIAAGIVSMLAYHIIVNLGMNVGIMPVTGVPLPLVSSGGSSLLMNMTAIGLLLGIGMRKHRLSF